MAGHTDSMTHEVAPTLEGPTPKTLRAGDQGAFWVNLAVSLLGFTGASAVLMPAGSAPLSPIAALVATIVGTVLGSVMLGLSAVPGARTGAPSMVVLRGLFGARLSVLPTVLNILQMIGWGTFELLAIASGARAVFGGGPQLLYVLIAAALTITMTIWPLGALRVLRKYVTVAVGIALVYLFVQFAIRPMPALTTGSWHGFWLGADAALAVAVSFIPMASDFSRHSRTVKGALGAPVIGYSIAQIACYAVGLLALVQMGNSGGEYDPYVAIPLGAVFLGVIVLREVDQSFANVYSTVMSVQNLFPRADRRILSIAIGLLCTVLAAVLDIGQYTDFLSLIGSVFVPMFGVLAADYFLRGWRSWNTSTDAPSRWGMLLAWLLGLATYQLINPGAVGWWSRFWTWFGHAIGFSPASWMSASLFSFLIAGLAAFAFGRIRSPRHR
ncbi:purine-cytosine permease family protein [Sciscionella sediminilitoris]|uniref:purine-cytosine permease family protein n=1 Tax=Sciscionella sediminilitoris TaxID=1445613 RepID=UPI000B28FAD8|nr:cytosine permease [Sciscionella sp. SE31]